MNTHDSKRLGIVIRGEQSTSGILYVMKSSVFLGFVTGPFLHVIYAQRSLRFRGLYMREIWLLLLVDLVFIEAHSKHNRANGIVHHGISSVLMI